MAEPALVIPCGNPRCKRPFYIVIVTGQQHILCGSCKTVTEVTFDEDEAQEEEAD